MAMMGMINMMDPPIGMMNPSISMKNNKDMPVNPINMIIPTMNPLDSKDITHTNLSIKNGDLWNLIFENNRARINIVISEQKLIKDAIKMYRVKADNKEKCFFIFNNKKLSYEIKICQSGLCNFSHILVLSLSNACGAIQIDIPKLRKK